MSESDPTGYRESPDTTDGPVTEDQTGDGPASGGAPDAPGSGGAPDAPGSGGAPDAPGSGGMLTTDDDAQTDDGVVRPGNQPD
jgi:hypothetical protein